MCFEHPIIYICRLCECRIRGGGYVRSLCLEGERTQIECQVPELGAEELREARDLCSRCLNDRRSDAGYQQPMSQEHETQYQSSPYQQQHRRGAQVRYPSRERTRPRQQFNHGRRGDNDGGGPILEGFDNLSISDDWSLPPDRSMPARERDDDLRRYRQDRQPQNDRDRVRTTLRGGDGEPFAPRARRGWDNVDTNSTSSVNDYDYDHGRERRHSSPGRNYNTVTSRRRGGIDTVARRRGDDRLQPNWDRYDQYSGYSGSTGFSYQSQGPFGITRTTDEYGVPEVTVPGLLGGTKIKKEGNQLVQVRRKKRSTFL
ncbi:hypothetical protein H2204_012387 [Knufia peltigerae]|uniref:Uncharacterized protein n=1 Tax=Knufia peltigerae TaxID=1002370 RepID=A0AA38XST3_9EURO|nr:hypothetical protein H2204_012387 [Knufia peltigerae]